MAGFRQLPPPPQSNHQTRGSGGSGLYHQMTNHGIIYPQHGQLNLLNGHHLSHHHQQQQVQQQHQQLHHQQQQHHQQQHHHMITRHHLVQQQSGPVRQLLHHGIGMPSSCIPLNSSKSFFGLL